MLSAHRQNFYHVVSQRLKFTNRSYRRPRAHRNDRPGSGRLEGKSYDEVSQHFVTTQEICSLHEEYFEDPSPTDVFPFLLIMRMKGYKVLGDVFICPETAIEYVTENGGDPYEEMTLYIVHGLLHLMG